MPDLFSALAARALGQAPGLRPVPVARFAEQRSGDEWGEATVEMSTPPDAPRDPAPGTGDERVPAPPAGGLEHPVRIVGLDAALQGQGNAAFTGPRVEAVDGDREIEPPEGVEGDHTDPPQRADRVNIGDERPLSSAVKIARQLDEPGAPGTDHPAMPPEAGRSAVADAHTILSDASRNQHHLQELDATLRSPGGTRPGPILANERDPEGVTRREPIQVTVSIGRVEITTPPRPQSAPAPVRRPAPIPRLSLDDYLKRGVRR